MYILSISSVLREIFGKEYRKLLANEIGVDKKEVRLSGSYSAMAGALHMSTKHQHLEKVPGFDPVWLAGTDEVGHWEQIVII